MGGEDVDRWLSYLANERGVSINTQKTALNAVVFMYHQFLGKELGSNHSPLGVCCLADGARAAACAKPRGMGDRRPFSAMLANGCFGPDRRLAALR
jgi:hypothetical protein